MIPFLLQTVRKLTWVAVLPNRQSAGHAEILAGRTGDFQGDPGAMSWLPAIRPVRPANSPPAGLFQAATAAINSANPTMLSTRRRL